MAGEQGRAAGRMEGDGSQDVVLILAVADMAVAGPVVGISRLHCHRESIRRPATEARSRVEGRLMRLS